MTKEQTTWGSRIIPALKRRVVGARVDVHSRFDVAQLRRAVPSFPTTSDISRAATDLRSAYDTYVSTVSTSGWAISFETSCLLLALCRSAGITSAVDTGSGFSSFVLRTWAAESGAVVASVDDDPVWLDRTHDYLERAGRDVGETYLWPKMPPAPVDLVFHDIASGSRREDTMPASWGLAERFVIWDDAHHAAHRRAMREVTRDHGGRFFNLASLTKDDNGRFAGMTVKSPSLG